MRRQVLNISQDKNKNQQIQTQGQQMWKLSYTIYKIKMRGIINQRQANNIYNALRRNNYQSRIIYSAKM